MKSEIIFINLDRVPERNAFMEGEFRKVGLQDAERFAAIDAKADGALSDARFRSGIGDRWALPKSAIACFESHRATWQLALARGLDAVVIFEDDMVLSADLPRALDKLLQATPEFDVVKIDHSPAPVTFGPVLEINGLDVRPILHPAPSAGGYVVTRQGLGQLLARSETYGDTLDDFLYTPHAGWRMYQLFPALAAQLVDLGQLAAQQSHISLNRSERELDPGINEHDLDRGPFWFRLRKELRRGGRRLAWKLWGKAASARSGGYRGFVPMAEDLKSR